MDAGNVKSAGFGFLGAGVFWVLAHSGPALAQIQVAPAFLRLQATTPGTQQSGHANVSGTIIAGQFQGVGSGVTSVDAAKLGGQTSSAFGQLGVSNAWSGVNNFTNAASSYAGSGTLLTGLNASNLASGTVPDARLTVGGDLTGPLSAANVTKLQGKPLVIGSPVIEQVLKFDGFAWQPYDDDLTLPYNAGTTGLYAMVVKNTTGLGILGQSFGSGSGIQGTSGNLSDIIDGAGVTGVSIVPGCFGVQGQARSGATAAGDFNAYGHDVMLATPSTSIETDGFLWRDFVVGSPSVAIPLAYGTVNAAGTIAGGTGNFTVNKTATGTYTVTVNGESYTNSSHTVTVTPVTSTPRSFGVVNPGNGGFLLRIWDANSALVDSQFQFTVWTAHPSNPG